MWRVLPLQRCTFNYVLSHAPSTVDVRLLQSGVNRLIHTAKIQVRKIKGSNLFQIYLTSILRTYKVSRKLQNIYYCQEGIIMLRSKDKTICRTQTEQSFFSLLCSNTLQWWIWKEITHLYQEKPRYNFIESTFLQRGGLKKICTQNPNM